MSDQRPPGFPRLRNVLHADGIPLPRLAARFATPLYVYSETELARRFGLFERAFQAVPHSICYSVKANSNLSVLRVLGRLGTGFDVVSGGELERVRLAHSPALQKVVFSGVGKTLAEVDAGLRAGIMLFNAESPAELELLAARSRLRRRRVPLALRVNPNVSATTHPYVSTGLRQHKFGVPIESAPDLYAQARKLGLEVAGVSVHIGSQILDAAPFGEALARLSDLVTRLRADGHDIRFLDAGGGLGIDYQAIESEKAFQSRLATYAAAVMAAARRLNVHLVLEPGRAIVAPAGILLTRIIAVKENGGKTFVITDAAMNDLIRPALYQAHHAIVPVAAASDSKLTVDVVGPICETGDFFARDRQLQKVSSGDLLAILDAGAYGMSLASNYNTRPRPAEVMVRGTRARVIRRRETVRDLVRLER